MPENLNVVQGDLSIFGNGQTQVTFDDQNAAAGRDYKLTAYSLQFSPSLPVIDFDGLTGIVLNAAANATTEVQGTQGPSPVQVHLGPGTNNLVVVGSAGDTLSSLKGQVTIIGQTGTDPLLLNDQNGSSGTSYTISASSISSSVSAPIVFQKMGSVTLNGGSGNDTYNIESTLSTTPVSIVAGNGSNTFNISPTAKNLGTIQGNLGLSANGTTNALVLDDQANTANSTYSLTSSTVTRTGAATISYASVDSVTLNGGSGNDTYNIQGTLSGTPVSVVGGPGNDAFNVSPSSQNLGTVGANLSINGGGGNDSLALDDQANTANSTYTLTPTTVTRAGMATITFSEIENLTLNGGSGNDTDDVTGTAAGMKLTLLAGTGNDSFDVAATAASSSVSINGAGGNDTLVGPNVASTWNITGSNAGTVGNVTFLAVENLTGGSAGNAFVFSAGATITGKIMGGGGGDWLDYAAYTTPVAVNLATGTATGVGGGLANIQDVRGGQGGNTLTGDAQGNILIGGAGPNTITGGTGRSILIGGMGTDTVTGNSGNDILIAGYTDYDSSTLAHDQALESILAEWQSGDSYPTRISKIKSGVGPGNADKLVWGVTVYDNSTANANKLTGGGGLSGNNWFFFNVSHTTTNKTGTEQWN